MSQLGKNRSYIECPRCGDRWYENLDEEGKPYSCYFCCNGTKVITKQMLEEDKLPHTDKEFDEMRRLP